VMLRHNGCMVKVVVDDFLPCLDNVPIYAKARSGALWCSFVEKALAKILGGYEMLSSTTSYDLQLSAGDVMNSLLPFPT
jgi:hypothetical protein